MATARRKSERPWPGRSSLSSLHCSIGSDLDAVLDDRKIKTDPIENKNRRTIIVKRENDSFGFTLQSYGLRRRNFDETELLSYVDYVEFGGPAQKAGMRAGDVILSVNGESMETADHATLVNCIRNCQDALRMVVLFEDVCRKIELHSRYIKLKQILAAKMYELRAVAYQEAKILGKVGAFGGAEESLSFTEMSDGSGSLGSAYFDCESILLAEQMMMSTPSVFCSSRELCLSDLSPEVFLLGSSLELPIGATPSRSPKVISGSSPIALPHSRAPSRSPNVASSRSPVDLPHSAAASQPPDFGYVSSAALPPPDDAFWNCSEFNYGSLPTRSRKRSLRLNRSFSTVKDQGTSRPAERRLVSSILFEEGDEPQDVRPTVEKKPENANLSVLNNIGPKLSPVECPSPSDSAPHKSSIKVSASVPNLIKLKVTKSPFLPRRSKDLKPKEDATDVHVGRDPRVMTKQMREQISNYVMTEDLCRKPNDPLLLGLRQLCNDFRDFCNLKQQRNSVELMLKNGAVRQPNSGSSRKQTAEFRLSKDHMEGISRSTNSEDLTGQLPEFSQTLPRSAYKSKNRCKTGDASSNLHSGLCPKAVDGQQSSGYGGNGILVGAAEQQTTSATESGEGLHESHNQCDVPDGSARSVSGTGSSRTFPTASSSSEYINQEDEVTSL